MDVASGRWLGAKPHAPGSGLLQAPIEVMWVDQWSIYMSLQKNDDLGLERNLSSI